MPPPEGSPPDPLGPPPELHHDPNNPYLPPRSTPTPARPQPYQYGHRAPPANVPSLLSFVFGLIGILVCPVFSLAGLTLGHIGLRQVRSDPSQFNSSGKGFAIAGLALGYLVTAVMVLILGAVFLS